MILMHAHLHLSVENIRQIIRINTANTPVARFNTPGSLFFAAWCRSLFHLNLLYTHEKIAIPRLRWPPAVDGCYRTLGIMIPTWRFVAFALRAKGVCREWYENAWNSRCVGLEREAWARNSFYSVVRRFDA